MSDWLNKLHGEAVSAQFQSSPDLPLPLALSRPTGEGERSETRVTRPSDFLRNEPNVAGTALC
jgi:hypothetical protein